MKAIRSILIANRSEIAIRVMRAASEMNIRTVAVYAEEDKLALHRFKADEAYRIGAGKKPIAAYLDIEDILRVAREAGVAAIHPGYGFLSENPEFAEACERAGIVFIGPTPSVMRQLGNKVSARELAKVAGVPVVPATGALPRDLDESRRMAAAIGYPLMLKASWGGGGRGMRVVENESELAPAMEVARREALLAFGNDEVYLEKLVRKAHHVEVQIIGDKYGNLVHLFERDCSVQRRNQKVVERAPAPYLSETQRADLCASALRLAEKVGYTHAGTVEFLMDADSGDFYFIEVNPRIQVEHTVTEAITGVDIVKAQIRISEGARIGTEESFVPGQEEIRLVGHALQCRVTTEDPENGFTPDYGRITAYRSAAGFGIRLDGGTAYAGAIISPHYDSLLVKVTAWGHSSVEANARMDRALREFRIRGVSSNLAFLENIIAHPLFTSGKCTTRFIDQTPELFQFATRRDRASKLLEFIGDVIVNGNAEMKGRVTPTPLPRQARLPACEVAGDLPKGTRNILTELGPEGFARWMREQQRVLITDTTMRDAHQSLFATRMRTRDMERIAPYYARLAPQLLSLECWGGATFDVSMRFLREDPWQRLAALREAAPNILLQMLLRASNAVGYTNYPDNVVRHFIHTAARRGVDLFRVFDSLNWVDNMRVAIDAVCDAGALCEAAICYTGDLFDPNRPYDLRYYVEMAKQLEGAGAHILAIKDMAGLCKPRAARALVKALKEEVGLPIHFHTHDTSGIAAASVLAAIDAGVDAVDAAIDSMSGLTSQPNLGSIAAALAGSERDPGLDGRALQQLSGYWEEVRRSYAPFEPDMRSSTSEVYRHEMPGGQVTNLREQARSLGIEHRWPDVVDAYAQVNLLFGDIVKVTPTSKVVGDMALYMVSNDLSAADVQSPDRPIDFPDSVVSLFKGELGYPPCGFPEGLQRKVLNAPPGPTERPGALLVPVDLAAERSRLESSLGRTVSEDELASHLMYPKVFRDYAEHQARYGDVSILPTNVFFYGIADGDEVLVELERGKTLVIQLLGIADAEEGYRKLFFELNGQPRVIKIAKSGEHSIKGNARVDEGNPHHIGAPMPGVVASVAAKVGQAVGAGDILLTVEAMKMEVAIKAERDCVIKEMLASQGMQVSAKDLLVVVQ